MSIEEYESSQYYKDYLQVEDPYYHAALMIIKNNRSEVIGAIALLRSISEGDFTPSVLSNMNILSEFISNLAVNHLLVNNLISQKCLFESLSNQSPTGLIIFNDSYPQLFISINTVKTHLNNIYRKMNVSNRFSLYSKLIGS